MKFKALQRLDEPWLVAQSTYSHIAKTIQSSELAEVVEIPESNEVETFNQSYHCCIFYENTQWFPII